MSKQTINDALIALQNKHISRAEEIARHIINKNNIMLPEAVHILASAALLRGRPATSIALLGRVLQKKENVFSPALEGRIHQTLGRALLAEKHYEAARAAFTIAVTVFPEEAASQAGLGEAYALLQKPEKAIRYLKKAISLAPKQAAFWALLARTYHQTQAWVEEAQSWEKVVTLTPQDGAAYANYGGALFACGRWDEAACALKKALESGCLTAQTFNNMGLVRSAQGYMQEACHFFEKAFYQLSHDDDVIANWSATLYDMGDTEGALSLLKRHERETATRSPKVRFNYAPLFLEQQEWGKGWQAFEERRFLLPLSITRPCAQLPLWQGEVGDEPIAVHAEQGLGDTVQFLRFLPEIVKRCPVRLHVPPEMMALVEQLDTLPLERVLPRDGVVVAQLSLLSAPYVLGMTDAPATRPYLSVDQQPEPYLIGLCWAGNAAYAFNRRRSIPVELLDVLKTVKNVRFVSLQQRAEAPGWMETPSLTHIDDLALTIARCSIVISVDTLVAHMAGAQGRPLWLLNRCGGDWRWKGHLWYQNVRCFQAQKARPPHESWPDVIERVRKALCDVFGNEKRIKERR